MTNAFNSRRPSAASAVAAVFTWLCLCLHTADGKAGDRGEFLELGKVVGLDYSLSRNRVATVESTGRVLVWNPDDGDVQYIFLEPGGRPGAPIGIGFLDALDALLVVGDNGLVTLLPLAAAEATHRDVIWDRPLLTFGGAAYVNGRVLVLAGTTMRRSGLYDVSKDARLIARFPNDDTASVLTPDGRHVLSIGERKGWLVNVETGTVDKAFSFPSRLFDTVFSRDGSLLAAYLPSYRGSSLGMWKADGGNRIAALSVDARRSILRLSISTDNRHVAAAWGGRGPSSYRFEDYGVTISNIVQQRDVASWRLPSEITTMGFVGGSTLVGATEAGLWRLEFGREPKPVRLRRGEATQVRTDEQLPTLFEAIVKQDEQRLRILLDRGLDVNLKDTRGATPLWVAAGRGRLDFVKQLLAAGARANGRSMGGSTALISAAASGHAAMVMELIAAGSDVNAQDMFGGTALQWAAYAGHSEVVEILLRSGADPDLRRRSGNTALELVHERHLLHRDRSDVLAILERVTMREPTSAAVGRLAELLNQLGRQLGLAVIAAVPAKAIASPSTQAEIEEALDESELELAFLKRTEPLVKKVGDAKTAILSGIESSDLSRWSAAWSQMALLHGELLDLVEAPAWRERVPETQRGAVLKTLTALRAALKLRDG